MYFEVHDRCMGTCISTPAETRARHRRGACDRNARGRTSQNKANPARERAAAPRATVAVRTRGRWSASNAAPRAALCAFLPAAATATMDATDALARFPVVHGTCTVEGGGERLAVRLGSVGGAVDANVAEDGASSAAEPAEPALCALATDCAGRAWKAYLGVEKLKEVQESTSFCSLAEMLVSGALGLAASALDGEVRLKLADQTAVLEVKPAATHVLRPTIKLPMRRVESQQEAEQIVRDLVFELLAVERCGREALARAAEAARAAAAQVVPGASQGMTSQQQAAPSTAWPVAAAERGIKQEAGGNDSLELVAERKPDIKALVAPSLGSVGASQQAGVAGSLLSASQAEGSQPPPKKKQKRATKRPKNQMELAE